MKVLRVILATLIAAIVLFAGLILTAGANLAGKDQKDDLMKAQLTIYVAPPLLDEGGTVIVVSNPISLEEWQNLPEGANPAREDPNNEKKKELREGDRLFGVVASSKVSIVEFVYPEDGTFGFNLVATEDLDKRRQPLRTRRILVGSGGYTDWSTGKDHKWEDVSTIHVYGPSASEADSRAARISSSAIMNLHPETSAYEGAILHSPTDEQVDQAVIKAEELK